MSIFIIPCMWQNSTQDFVNFPIAGNFPKRKTYCDNMFLIITVSVYIKQKNRKNMKTQAENTG